jgi:hypothetical protein
MRLIFRSLPAFAALPLFGACGDDAAPAPAVCESNAACEAADPNLPICNADTGACEALPPCESDAACAAENPETPLCNVATSRCEALPAGHPIGWRFGTADSVDIVTVFKPNRPYEATDLGFHPTRNELWVINRDFEVPGVCAESNPGSARCQSLAGFMQVIFNPGAADQRVERHDDGNAWHFKRRPLAMAMGENDTWASCSEAATGNFEDDPVMYNGPTLWSSDLDVYGKYAGPGTNGSHLDMLHNTPFCVGIAHEEANIYWMFNGFRGSIDRVDFAEDHGPGMHDHSDGTYYRYAEGQLKRLENTPGHMVFNPADKHLYVVDSGNSRIVKLDTTSGTYAGPFRPNYEPLADYGVMDGAVLTEVVPAGRLNQPGGLALHDGLLYVADMGASRFLVFDTAGNELRSLDTDLPPGTIGGIEIGPDNKLYFTNMKTGEVHRIDPK